MDAGCCSFSLPPVMLSPRGQSGSEAKILASASKIWPRPRPQIFGLGVASISLSYYIIGHFSGKNCVKFGNFVNFSGNNLKSYVGSFFIIIFGLSLGLNLQKLTSASALRFWIRLISLVTTKYVFKHFQE